MSNFWDNNHSMSSLYHEMFAKHVPFAGACSTLEAETFRAAVRIAYDYYNNGFCNNRSQEFEYITKFYSNNDKLVSAMNSIRPYVSCPCGDIPEYGDEQFENVINTMIEVPLSRLLSNVRLTPISKCIEDMKGWADDPWADDEEDFENECELMD